MHDVVLVLGEVNQVDPVLFGVDSSLLGPALAVVNDYLRNKVQNALEWPS